MFPGSESVLDFFSEFSQVCEVFIKLTPKEFVIELTYPDIITETTHEGHPQLEAINFISDVNKQALKMLG